MLNDGSAIAFTRIHCLFLIDYSITNMTKWFTYSNRLFHTILNNHFLFFQGPFCAQTQCDAQPCENGGLCKLTSNGFICICPDTRFGGKRCHQRLQPCAEIPKPCSGHGICHDDDKSKDTSLGYRCQCHLWWSGELQMLMIEWYWFDCCRYDYETHLSIYRRKM